MTTIEVTDEFESIVNEILQSPYGEVSTVRAEIDSRLASAAQFLIWETENPNIIRGQE